jgi:hypothetical protein
MSLPVDPRRSCHPRTNCAAHRERVLEEDHGHGEGRGEEIEEHGIAQPAAQGVVATRRLGAGRVLEAGQDQDQGGGHRRGAVHASSSHHGDGAVAPGASGGAATPAVGFGGA